MQKKRMQGKYILFLVLALLLSASLVTGCSKRKSAESARQSAGQTKSEKNRDSEAGEPQKESRNVQQLSPSSKEGPEPQHQNVSLPPQRDLGPLSEFLFLDVASRHVSSDRRIGRLLDRFSSNAEKRAIYRLADEFFAGLKRNKITESLIAPEERLELLRSLSYTLREDTLPRAYRIGDFSYSDETSGYLKILVFGDPGSSVGELYFEKTGSGWLISDVQVDFLALGRPESESSSGFTADESDSPF